MRITTPVFVVDCEQNTASVLVATLYLLFNCYFKRRRRLAGILKLTKKYAFPGFRTAMPQKFSGPPNFSPFVQQSNSLLGPPLHAVYSTYKKLK